MLEVEDRCEKTQIGSLGFEKTCGSAHGSLNEAFSPSSMPHTIYGPSSNVSFLKQITVAADPHSKTKDDTQEPGVPTLLGFSTSRPSSPGSHSKPMKLPESALVTSFVQSYWEFIHTIFPILHRPSFTALQSSLIQSNDQNHCLGSIIQATLSIVLALGAQRTEGMSVTERDRYADRLYKQSCTLVSVDLLDESSLAVVQLLLLRGIYLHYSTYADRCWNTIGVALRVAQGLGLHHDGHELKKDNQLEREMRRRVWYCCVTLDRYCSTRPSV